jgi:cytoskeletal protein CcmA (bactofilin family)
MSWRAFGSASAARKWREIMELEREQTFRTQQTGQEGDIKAFLGAGTEFQGTLTFDGTIRVDGKLSGEVISKDTLIVGEGAEVEAEINVGILISWGSVKGNVRAEDRIQLHESSELTGNISTPMLTIAEGAFFNGSCEMPHGADKVTPISTASWRASEEASESPQAWSESEKETEGEESAETS